MLTITKLEPGTARNYFKEEFAHKSNSYYAQDGSTLGRWNGQLAMEFGLSGRVTEQQYMRLIEGQHPEAGEQLVRHRDTVRTRAGLEAAHVPAWDVGLGLPKSWSIAAIVGGDKRIFEIAEKANLEALEAFEKYAQAHGGGRYRPITTGAFLVATFRHETARPVDGYSAPQIHFHNLLMNLQKVDGQYRALSTIELYRAKSYAMQVFYDSLARQGRQAGYQIDFAEKTFAPELRGISKEYRDHESERERLILEEMQERGVTGGKAAHEIAKYNREDKLHLTPEQFIQMQKEHGQPFADELRIVPEALERGPVKLERVATAEQAVRHAEASLSQKHSTFEHYELGREALRYALGTVTPEAIEREITRRIQAGDLVQVHHYRDHAPGARYATRETLRLERETIERVLRGRGAVEPIASNVDLSRYRELADNPARQQILRDYLTTRDQFTGLNGTAGSAKSTAAVILKDIAEANGYRVKGLAPTGTATAALREKGISADTLQMHLTQARLGQTSEGKTLFLVDETSLAATKDIHDFAQTVKPGDHTIFIGDDAPDQRKVGQHISVDAGRVFQMLQEAGMQTAHFNRVYRQKDPELKKVVLAFRNGQTEQALRLLQSQGRIHEAENSRNRFAEIARVYALSPQGTLVISPDNQSRMMLNDAIRDEMRRQGILNGAAYELPILVARDLTKAEMKRASAYHLQDVVQYRKGNQAVGVGAREYATVIGRDVEGNRLTVKTQAGKVVTYDPSRASGVNVFETRQQEFCAGERIQFTAKDKKLGAHTRDRGTIRSLDEKGNVEVVLDRNSKVLKFNLEQHGHVDHGYVLTSHSAQSQTVERVLINVNTADPRLRGLLNEVFAYVAASRPEFDLRLFANHASELYRVLSRVNEEQKAHSPEQIEQYRERLLEKVRQAVEQHQGKGQAQDFGIVVG